MIGTTVSHYRIVEKLGGGGMGVVYKATDLRLNRSVALKFLAAELTRDRDANQRFRQEAQSASALDHPNICTIHEIDETPSGELFLTMAYYEGETLKDRIARGPLTPAGALDVAIQVAQGLARAHQSGIVHRDIKPANLIVTAEGVVKIVDFGLAKLTTQADITRTGMVLGTVAYMSPEQTRGDALDARTDVWSLGVVLYELLTGRRPFGGKDDVAVISAILTTPLEPIGKVRQDVPAHLQQVIARALARDPAARYPSATEMLAELTACRMETEGTGAMRADQRSVLRRPLVAAVIAAVLLAAGIPAGLALRRSANERWARNEGVAQIRRLVEADDSAGAFALSREVERYVPVDAALVPLWNQFSLPATILSSPEGADVYVQPYSATGAAWQYLGKTPIKAARLVRDVFRVRIEKPGFDPQLLAARNPGSLFNTAGVFQTAAFVINLPAAGSAPGSVPVPGGAFPVGLTGFNSDDRITLTAFQIDRHEVTNREFKVFVQGGGYATEKYWAGLPFVKDDRPISWRDASAAFVDSTGRPGPATWELGDHPSGHADDPVSGVSWYEAAAYCRASGKMLPTVFHWARAGLSTTEIGSPLAPAIIPLSNFSNKGLAPVGSYGGLGPYGTFDMAGNAREWVWNEASHGRRWILGGGWSDPDYMFTVPNSLPPLDRSALNGFRCATYPDPAALPTELVARFETYARDYRKEKAASDESYAFFKRQYAPLKAPLNARVDARNTSNPAWIRETLSFDAGYANERVVAYLFLPTGATPPYQVVVHFPGVGPFVGAGSSANYAPSLADFICKSGRALVAPVFKGSFERWDAFLNLQGQEYLNTFRTRMIQWRHDLGRTIDVLAERKDLDVSRLAYYGSSFGASTAFPLVALEDRIKTAILGPSGFTYREMPAEADAINYVSRVTVPVLMMGGRHDYIFPLETSQKPMFDRLGTPADRKKQVTFEAGHANFPRSQVIREVLGWLDRYLGPVNGRESPAK